MFNSESINIITDNVIKKDMDTFERECEKMAWFNLIGCKKAVVIHKTLLSGYERSLDEISSEIKEMKLRAELLAINRKKLEQKIDDAEVFINLAEDGLFGEGSKEN